MPYPLKTHCKHGHLFAGNFTMVKRNGRMVRLCLICARRRRNADYTKNRRKLPPNQDPEITEVDPEPWMLSDGIAISRGYWSRVFDRVRFLLQAGSPKWVRLDLEDLLLRPYQIGDIVSAARKCGKLEVRVWIKNSAMYVKGVRDYAVDKPKPPKVL